MRNSHAWTLRLMAGLGGLVLMLGILTAFQHGVPQAPKAAARTGAVALRTSGGSTSRVVTTAYAATSGFQYCYNNGHNCLNAWGGGPWVDVYTGGIDRNDTNQQFTIIYNGNYVDLQFTGGNFECIGDAYNNSGYADTSLDPCGTGWGTNFTLGESGCPAGDVWFKNSHWGAYLGASNNAANGSHFYLNTGKTCYSESFV